MMLHRHFMADIAKNEPEQETETVETVEEVKKEDAPVVASKPKAATKRTRKK